MSQLQPKCMIVDCFDQNGADTCTIRPQGIGKNLVTCQCTGLRWDVKLLQALANPPGKGLFRMGNTGQTVSFTEDPNPVTLAVGYNAKLNVGCQHIRKPLLHFGSRGICGMYGYLKKEG